MSILDQAAKITSEDRRKKYGHPSANLGNTAKLWSAYLERKVGVNFELDARDVCMMMVLVKVSRDANAPDPDNLLDIVGYARCAEIIEEDEP